MSKFEDQTDSVNSICPYCKHSFQVEAEDYSESMEVQECYNCEKKYYLCQEFSVDNHTRPDCELNGGKHDYYRMLPKSGNIYLFCDSCGHTAPDKTVVDNQENE